MTTLRQILFTTTSGEAPAPTVKPSSSKSKWRLAFWLLPVSLVFYFWMGLETSGEATVMFEAGRLPGSSAIMIDEDSIGRTDSLDLFAHDETLATPIVFCGFVTYNDTDDNMDEKKLFWSQDGSLLIIENRRLEGSDKTDGGYDFREHKKLGTDYGKLIRQRGGLGRDAFLNTSYKNLRERDLWTYYEAEDRK